MSVEWRDDEPIDELIARARLERGMSQYRLADAVARVSGDPRVTRQYITRWENRKRIPDPHWRDPLGDVLGIPREVLDRAAEVARVRRLGSQEMAATSLAPTMATVPPDDSSRTLEEILNLWDELMRRRNFLGSAATTAVSTLLSGRPVSATPLAPASHGPEVFETCAQLTATYRRLDNLLGPSAVYVQAAEHHRRLVAWLGQSRTVTERRKLGALMADSGDLLAWLCFDLEQYDEASGLYRQTADVARELGDVSREAYLIGRMSRTLSECGQHDHALAFADGAEQVAATQADPAVRSWLAVTRAFVHACQGNESACRADLERAAALLERVADAPRDDYIAFYGPASFHKWAGHSLLKLSEKKDAAVGEGKRAIDRALDDWSGAAVRESAEVLAACASARLAQRNVAEAARMTGKAYDIAIKTDSRRNLRHVTHLRTRLRPYRHTRAVRTLDEHLLTGR